MASVPQRPLPIHSKVPHHTATSSGDWVGLGEASRLLGISQGTLRRWADDGRVAVFTTPGGHRRFSRRMLRALLPTARVRRPALAALGASPERIARRYRAHGEAAVAGAEWLDRLTESETGAFRDLGRRIVECLLSYLDADDEADRGLYLNEASGLAETYGRHAARSRATIGEAVEAFLQFRTPFIRSLVDVARRRGLDTREATELLVAAETAMDRLLLGTMRGHAGTTRR